MKTKFKATLANKLNNVICITPCIYTNAQLSIWDEEHWVSIEFRWLKAGVGVKFYWDNKRFEVC